MPALSAMQLDPGAARSAFLGRWRDTIVTIIDRGTYLDIEDIAGLVDASFPGADEIFGLLVLARLLTPGESKDARSPWTRFVIDTAPTGHTLRLLALPDTFAAVISLLDTMQAKHRFMVSALTHRYRRDVADDFLDEMRRTLGRLRSALGDSARAGAVLVTRAEPVVTSETVRYAGALRELGISVVAIVVEALRSADAGAAAALNELWGMTPGGGLFALPRIDPPPVGLRESSLALGKMALAPGVQVSGGRKVRGAGKGLRKERQSEIGWKSGGAPQRANRRDPAQRSILELLRTLTIVGGKGGVGKTTVSCALAILSALAENNSGDTLLVSTDPAPSIGDALGIPTSRWAQSGPETLDTPPRLHVWQMDAATAFRELRDRYRERIDALFDALMGRSIDAVHDRAILRDLLALAPPGVDELYALASLGEALETGRYARIIVDPAPTGHLLRLIELPVLALDWSHRLMRLIMKYRDVAGLGDAAQDLINFSRRTRALDRLLHDRSRAGVVLVSLGEPVVVAETERLAERLRMTGVSILGEVRNRGQPSDRTASRLAGPGSIPDAARPIFLAPELDRPPIGVATIRDWCQRWQPQND